MVIRGLLASNGIYSPDFDPADPFPLSEPIEGNHEVEIFVLESQADKARKIIEEHLKENAASSSPDPENE
jgi:hypothetical protein